MYRDGDVDVISLVVYVFVFTMLSVLHAVFECSILLYGTVSQSH